MLVECLIYLAVVMVVIGAGLSVFFHALDFTRRLRGNADDIARALHAGEVWRADVRAASGAIRLEKGDGGVALYIPRREGEVAYFLVTNMVVRCDIAGDRCKKLLAGVKSSAFHNDVRGPVRTWRWELELGSKMKAVRVVPRFTFTAVPPCEVDLRAGRPTMVADTRVVCLSSNPCPRQEAKP